MVGLDQGGAVHREYTLAELASVVGMTERNVRAYRSRGLISPPRLRGRVGYYGYDHLSQLRLVQALTSRGLSLQVVGQLMERGVAQHELARLLRAELPHGRPVALSPAVIDELTVGGPELLDALVEVGVANRTASGFEADPALLALANELAAHGVPAAAVTRLVLAGGRAAVAAAAALATCLQAPRDRPVPVGRREAAGRSVDGVVNGAVHGAGYEAARNGTQADSEADGTADGAHSDATANGTDAGEVREPDATTAAVALELTTTAFRIALESRLSRLGP
jgi:DNA-binding transcriptional MerR regulator